MKGLCQCLKGKIWIFALIQIFLLGRVFIFLSLMMKVCFMQMMVEDLVGVLNKNNHYVRRVKVVQSMLVSSCVKHWGD